MKYQESAVSITSSMFVSRWVGLVMGLLVLSLWALPAQAQAEEDPPARVGRLAEVEGQVWFYDTEAREWIEAKRNRPITTGDRISTERGGRAELRVGSTVLRVDGSTELEVALLDDEHLSLQLHDGSVAARLRTREAAREFELLTTEGRFEAIRTGSYRFDREDDTTEATVLSGQLQFSASDSGVTVNPGQRAEFWNDGGTQHSFSTPRRDEFADWVAASEGREERSVSTRYVSPEMTGVEDLDRYGRWEQDREYGALWTPINVAPGWAPYRMGHWVWISPWGWTWVDDAPWGFAPFHYGRWVLVRNTWCWSPGRYVARPVYAPALVAWVGGPRVNVSVRVGRYPTVGWFPLAPHEVYVPGYRFTPRYLRHVNYGNVREIRNIHTIVNNPGRSVEHFSYRNRGLPNAVTVVPSTVLERRQPVGPAVVGMNTRLHRELVRQSPRIDPPVPGLGGRRIEARQPGGPATVVPPAPGRVGMIGDGRDGRWEGQRGDRDHREERDRREAREVRLPERDMRVGQPPVQQPFSRDRREERPVPGQPAGQINPLPVAPPAIGRPVQPGIDTRPDTRFGRPPTMVNEPARPRPPQAGGPGRDHRDHPGTPVAPVTPVAPPPPAVAPVAPPVQEAPPPPPRPAPFIRSGPLGDGDNARRGFSSRDHDEQPRQQQRLPAPPPAAAVPPPAVVAPQPRPPAPPVQPLPPPAVRAPVVQPPPQQPVRPQVQREADRPGAPAGRPNEPGRGEGMRHRQMN